MQIGRRLSWQDQPDVVVFVFVMILVQKAGFAGANGIEVGTQIQFG